VITPLTYHILMALADQERHGYGIIKEIEARLGPGAAPSTGALYLALQRMDQDGLIDDAPARGADDDPRRRYYRLTRTGRAVAVQESARLAELVKIARRKKLLPRGAGA
jgi:DNA-binding PadR family transcriptional regulator